MKPPAHTDYTRGRLDESDVGDDPFVAVTRWLDDAAAAGVDEPTAMAVSTVDDAGRPSARNVLLRGLDHGFVFYTNFTSHKGRDLARNPNCALLFSWLGLQRQIRVDGVAERLDDATCDDYFASRPRGSQLGAWASPQSEVIVSRDVLDDAVTETEARFAGAAVPRPPHWGGFRVIPATIELWQGRANRLHDRLRFRRAGDAWVIERLAP